MHEILEIIGHVVRFGVSVAALAAGVAAVARCRFHPKSIPLGLGLGGLGFGDLVTLVLNIFGFWGGPIMRYLVAGFFVMASLAILVGIVLIADALRETADAH